MGKVVTGRPGSFLGPRKSGILTALFCLLLACAVGVLAFFPEGLPYLSFLGERPFGTVLRGLCLAAFVLLLFKKVHEHRLASLLIRSLYVLVFLPVILLPVFRCFFTVPFVFCRACPDRCAWGILRAFIVNSAVLLNLFPGRAWCAHFCPLGIWQTAQAKVLPWHVKLAPLAGFAGYVFLFIVAAFYGLSFVGDRWVRSFEIGWYAWGTVAVVVAAAIIAAAFFIPRFFCRCVCPVGACAQFLERPVRKVTAAA